MGAVKKSEWATLKARDVMRTDLLTISATTPLSEVERLLSEHGIGGAPVTDETGHIVGVVSMRDLLDRYAEDSDSRPRRGQGFYHLAVHELDEEDFDSFEVPGESEDTAGDVMTADVFSVDPGTSLPKVARKMLELKVHRVLVAEDHKHVGIISTFDLLKIMAG